MTDLQAAELQIEVWVEKRTDRLDRAYMDGEMTERQYHDAMEALSLQADERYARLRYGK